LHAAAQGLGAQAQGAATALRCALLAGTPDELEFEDDDGTMWVPDDT
jgi:hypothetical protein